MQKQYSKNMESFKVLCINTSDIHLPNGIIDTCEGIEEGKDYEVIFEGVGTHYNLAGDCFGDYWAYSLKGFDIEEPFMADRFIRTGGPEEEQLEYVRKNEVTIIREW